MFGDCLERLKEIPDKSVDLILTDPPYGVTYHGWDKALNISKVWPIINNKIKDKSVTCLFCLDKFSASLKLSNTKMYRYEWIWEKPNGSNFSNCKLQPMKVHEHIIIFSHAAAVASKGNEINYYPQMEIGKPYSTKRGDAGLYQYNHKCFDNHKTINSGTRYPRSIIKFNQDKGKHPTQKPVALLRYLIKTYTLENETVLDFTMGSGSTGVASLIEKRNFIGIENNKEYFKLASNRIKDYKSEIK